MKFYITLFLLCLGACTVRLSAQVSTIRRTVDGKQYIVHTIDKGQTVYSITKLYGITDKEIYAANPGAEAGIRAGAELLIPVKQAAGTVQPPAKDPVKEPVKTPVQTPQKTIMHTVSRSETLYGLSKQYGVTVDAILAANPGLENGLKNGASLKIPQGADTHAVETETAKEEPSSRDDEAEAVPAPGKTVTVPEPVSKLKSKNDCIRNASRKKEYRVALLLPFGNNPKPENKQARVAFQFYAGVIMAQKLYQPKEMTLVWKVYNTGESDDSVTISKLIASGELDGADIIVGPLYASGLYPIAAYAASRQIPVLSPTSRMGAILAGNPYLIKTTPSPESFLTGLAEYMTQRFDHMILVEPSGVEDSLTMRKLKTELEQLIKNDPTKSVSYVEAGKTSPMDLVKPGVRNLIYYPTKKELTVTNFLTGLRKIKKSDKITIMGDEAWLKFRNFDPDYYSNVGLHVPVLHFATPQTEGLQPFVAKFREEFKTDPEIYAYRGYDAACYVTDMLENYGNSLPECIRYDSAKYLFTPFKMLKIQGGGYDNKGVTVLVIEDYRLHLETN